MKYVIGVILVLFIIGLLFFKQNKPEYKEVKTQDSSYLKVIRQQDSIINTLEHHLQASKIYNDSLLITLNTKKDVFYKKYNHTPITDSTFLLFLSKYYPNIK